MAQSEPRSLSRPERLLVRLLPAVLVLLGFGLRVLRLGHQELRGDETFGYFFSLQPVRDIVRQTLALQEPHPVASYLLQHAWLQLIGHSEFALRFVSAWFGTLSVALAYRLARAAGLSRRSAAGAAALLALSPYAIWHSQDARMYSISLAFTLGSTLLALVFVSRPRVPIGPIYVFVSLAALHTHYFTAFILVAQSLWVAWITRRSHTWSLLRRWTIAQLALLILFLPWLAVAASTLRGYHGNGDSPAALTALVRSARVFLAGEMAPDPVQNVALFVGAALLVLLLLGRPWRRANASALALVALTVIVPLAATWLSAQSRPIFNERYLIAAAPGLYILLGAALEDNRRVSTKPDRLRKRAASMAFVALLAIGLVAVQFYYFHPAYSKSRGWRQLAAALDGFTEGFPPDAAWVVGNSPDPTLWYYYPTQVERWVLPPRPRDRIGADRVVEELVQAGARRVVIPLVKDVGWDGAGIAAGALSEHYRPLVSKTVSGWEVMVAENPAADPRRVDVEFEGGLRLNTVRWQPDAPVGGGLLGVHLEWSGTTDRLPAGAKASVQLLDPAGVLASQDDSPLPSGLGASSHPLLLPAHLRAGEYRLIVAVYDPSVEALTRLATSVGSEVVELDVVMLR